MILKVLLLLPFLMFLQTCGGMEEDLYSENVFLSELQNENDDNPKEMLKKIVSPKVGNQINKIEGNEQATGAQSRRIVEKENPNQFHAKIFSAKIPILMLIAQFLSVKEFARNFRGINRNTSLLPIERFLKGAGISDVFREYFKKDGVSPEEFKSFCSILFDTKQAWKMGLEKINNVPELPPMGAPFLLYSFTEQGQRFFPISFSRWMDENERKYIEVLYQSGGYPMYRGPKWVVKYFDNCSISALKRTETTGSVPDRGDDTLRMRHTITEEFFDERNACQNVHKLPISNKVFVTKNLLRHSKEQQSQDALQDLRMNLECKNQ